MTDPRDLIEPGPERDHSPAPSIDEVTYILCKEEPETPTNNLGDRESAAPVATAKEGSGLHAVLEQEVPPISPEHRLPREQTPPHPDPSPDSQTNVETPPSQPPRNIIFFGETGVGKSAIINMLREKSEEQFDDAGAVVSNAALGCTLVSTKYPCRLFDEVLMLWDTAGLVEGEFGNVTAGQAEDNLVSLLRGMEGGGVSLLVYCIRARRFRTIIKSHYELFFEKTCGGRVPIVLVVTGLENEEFMEDWWVRNEQEFRRRGIEFTGHACITSTRGKAIKGGGHVFDDEYEESFGHLQGAILNYATPTNVQVMGFKGPSWAPWTSAMHKVNGARKKVAKLVPDMSSSWGQIKDDKAEVLYSTVGPYPPQPLVCDTEVPAATHSGDAAIYPAYSHAGPPFPYSAGMGAQGPMRFGDAGVPAATYAGGATIGPVYNNAGPHPPHFVDIRGQHSMLASHVSTTSAPGIHPIGNVAIHHQPQPIHGPRLPQVLKRALEASQTAAPALTQIKTQADQSTARFHPPPKGPKFPYYLDNGNEPVAFHQETSDHA